MIEIARLILGAALLSLALIVSPDRAFAQSCTADSQCPNGGQSKAECIGDTLVVRRYICAGLCQERIELRQDCRGPLIGRCVGHAFERVTGRCNATLKTCEQRADRDLCVKSCSCRNNRLYISTDTCSPVSGCNRTVMNCPKGCTCNPEPRCL
ncbi:MAG: hypothetical protein F9K44_13620 [Hyphomicrobiaceae bacterium]|nr:MAG: hypothetical protein F9K44_13620 [Hyphomicrobiaceae bacterium]